MVLSTPTMNLMLALCVISSLITAFFFLPFFFLSHPICENLSPGALLYQGPAAAVILDMAGSRYRKTARARSIQKNLEIPLIYPRLWLQSKPVAKKKKKRKDRRGVLAVGKAQADNCVRAARVRKESFSHPLLQGTREMLDMAMRTEERLAATAELGPARGQAHAGRHCCQYPPSPAEKTPSRLPRDVCF